MRQMIRLLLAAWLSAVATANFYVCEAGNPKFMGHYVQVSGCCDSGLPCTVRSAQWISSSVGAAGSGLVGCAERRASRRGWCCCWTSCQYWYYCSLHLLVLLTRLPLARTFNTPFANPITFLPGFRGGQRTKVCE